MSEIKFYELKCKRCGGQLEQNGAIYKCESCGKTFEKQVVTDVVDQLRAVLNEQKQEAVANLRRQLWAEMHEENINSEKVRSLARDIKKYLPEDYFANFCEIANSEVENNSKQINAFLNNTPQSALADYADVVLDFMIKSLKTENITVLTQFIERAFAGKDGASYDKYTTRLENEADKVDKGIYDLDLPRDVFLAYSSADMDKVLEVCDFLESNDISCFLALRNLRHGRNAVHNYDQALKTAIDHCKTIVFVSSTHSRSRSCDAFTKELPYIRQKELDSAPHQYRHDYSKLPAEYMMFRVEYLIEDYCGSIAEKITKEFFHDLEWCKSKEAVAGRILNYLIGAPETTEEAEEVIPAAEIPVKEDKSVKYCKKCGTKNRLAAKFCSKCKGTEFAETYDEYLASKIKFCALCGTQCDSEANACDNCGSEMFVPTKKAYEDLIAQMAEEERQQKIREEQERLRREEEERKRKEEERRKKEEAERLRKIREEQERLRREEEERQRKIREEEDRKRKEEANRLRKVREEQERLRLAEEERQRKIREEEERKRKEEEKRKLKEEAERQRYIRENFDIKNGVLVKYKGNGGDVAIPDGVTSIGEKAFEFCTSLKSVIIPNSVTSIGEYAFKNCFLLKELVISKGVSNIGKGAFDDCSNLNLIFEDTNFGNKYLEKDYQRYIYENFEIHNGVLVDYKGSGCDITIPSVVTAIGEDAFKSSVVPHSIIIPKSVITINEYAFINCHSLVNINVSPDNKKYKSIDGILYSIDGKTLIRCAIGRGAGPFTIPDCVTTICEGAFFWCEHLTSITIPYGVTSVGNNAFCLCKNLTAICCRVNKPLLGLPKGWDKNWLGKGDSKCKAQVIWNYKGN